ncbi:hypothetical protein PENPOL_c015G00651 [Penicillium polonicum]|uniref:Uncharacterized protein n=1 Tax=Penicillium polonicum TaxID=60169 RepID=A0A1V6NB54_PENPO|nr:hypothetical protein PENPOL_c015G00651 [Penicillium polonicum]
MFNALRVALFFAAANLAAALDISSSNRRLASEPAKPNGCDEQCCERTPQQAA